jgi:hypothetical protein
MTSGLDTTVFWYVASNLKASLMQTVKTCLQYAGSAITRGPIMAMAGQYWHLCSFFFLSFFRPFFCLCVSHSWFRCVLLFIYLLKITVFRHMTPCTLTNLPTFWSKIFNYREKSVNFYQSTRRHIPEDSNPHTHHNENLKSLVGLFLQSFAFLLSTFRSLLLKFFIFFCFFCLFLLLLHLTTVSELTFVLNIPSW